MTRKIAAAFLAPLCALVLTSAACDGGSAAGRDDADVSVAADGMAAADGRAGPDDSATASPRSDDVALKNVVFLGTSLTAGYGIGAELAFPALIERRIREAGLPFRVTSAGISGETSAGGLRRIDWVLQNPVDVLVLELGANDGLRALNPDSMKSNLRAILERTRARYPDAALVIAGMEAPPNLGARYTTAFRSAYADLAREFDALLIPFLLLDVAAVTAMNQEDGIHPNERGHQLIADNLWKTLRPVLEARAR